MKSGLLGPALPTVRVWELDDELSLYDSATDRALVLNATASDIWRLLDGSHDLDSVVRILAAQFDVREADIRNDVVATVVSLAGFVQVDELPA